jgi:hypothetical protein
VRAEGASVQLRTVAAVDSRDSRRATHWSGRIAEDVDEGSEAGRGSGRRAGEEGGGTPEALAHECSTAFFRPPRARKSTAYSQPSCTATASPPLSHALRLLLLLARLLFSVFRYACGA